MAGSQYEATTAEGFIDQTRRDLTLLSRQGRGADLGYGGSMRNATLEPSYRGGPTASVEFEGWEGLVGPFEWLNPYEPTGSREVVMVKFEGTWMVQQQRRGSRHVLQLGSNWLPYNERTVVADWRLPYAELLPSGYVILSGLLHSRTTPGADQIIGYLPEGMRPDIKVMRAVVQSDVPRALYITPAGEIRVSGGGYTNGFVSLDGIGFWAAGVLDWQTIGTLAGTGLINGYTDWYDSDTSWGHARLALDEFGFAWLDGIVGTGTVTDNTVITALPAAYRGYLAHHMATAGQESFAMIGTLGNNLVVKGGTPAGWLGLGGGGPIVTAAARADNPWHDVEYFNTWAKHPDSGTTFTIPSTLRRGDGLCMASGLISGGTVGGNAFVLEQETQTGEWSRLLHTGSANAFGRMDLRPGAFLAPQLGSNVWFSLDTKAWMAA